jgi:hypothetical protein
MNGPNDLTEHLGHVTLTGTEHAAGYLCGYVGERVTPTEATEGRVGERDNGVEVPARHRAEHENDREQAGRGRGGVLEQLQPDIARREGLCRDPRANHQGREERGAKQLGEQASCKGRVHAGIVLH